QGEIFKRGKRDIVAAADAGFQHATAPHWNAVFPGHVVHGNGLTEAAHAPDLDIDDAAGGQLDCSLSVAGVVNGLIQADAGLDLLLKLRVKVKIIMPERLLNHEQIEAVELFQVVDLVQRVSGVGVTAQQNVRPAITDFAENLHVPARLALDLDAAIAGGELGLNLFQQLLMRVLNADRNAE